MPETVNLLIPHVEESQAQKAVTVSTGFDLFDAAITELLTTTITSADVTLANEQALQCAYIRVSGVFIAARNLIVPTDSRKLYVVEHSGSAFNLTVKTSGGTGITLSPSTTQLLYADGTNVVAVTGPTGAGGLAYNFHFQLYGLPGDGAEIAAWPIADNISLPAGFTGSKAKLGIATTGSISFDVRKNGVSVGSIDFSASATLATFTAASPVNLASGDELTIVAPSPQDATAAGFRCNLRATRT